MGRVGHIGRAGHIGRVPAQAIARVSLKSLIDYDKYEICIINIEIFSITSTFLFTKICRNFSFPSVVFKNSIVLSF